MEGVTVLLLWFEDVVDGVAYGRELEAAKILDIAVAAMMESCWRWEGRSTVGKEGSRGAFEARACAFRRVDERCMVKQLVSVDIAIERCKKREQGQLVFDFVVYASRIRKSDVVDGWFSNWEETDERSIEWCFYNFEAFYPFE
jgi:hypothetical protein